MELRELKTFLAVVEHGGFRRAAIRLHFSQPAITAHIRALERSLGVALFDRDPTGVRLTAAGDRFHPAAVALVDLSEAAVTAARQDPWSGALRIGVYPGGAGELTRPLLVELGRLWPGVQLEVAPLTLDRWGSSVETVDALIMRDPVDHRLVRATELYGEPMVVAVPWTWPQREAVELSLAETLALPLVRPSPGLIGPLTDYWCLGGLRGLGEVDFRGYGAECPEDVAADVHCGFGAAMATRSLLRRFDDGRLRAIPFQGSPWSRVWLTTPVQDRRPIIDALHVAAQEIVGRIGSLVLPELAARTDHEFLSDLSAPAPTLPP